MLGSSKTQIFLGLNRLGLTFLTTQPKLGLEKRNPEQLEAEKILSPFQIKTKLKITPECPNGTFDLIQNLFLDGPETDQPVFELIAFRISRFGNLSRDFHSDGRKELERAFI